MRRILTLSALILVLSIHFSSCKTVPKERMGIMKIAGICRGEKIYFKKFGRYATFDELLANDLADSDFTRGWGYTSEVKLTERGYLASVTPNDFSSASMFYVNESGIIKAHRGDNRIHPNDPDCTFPNGAKCICFDE